MNNEEFKEIMRRETTVLWDGDNALQGLNIISKYLPGKKLLQGAAHDIIYSVDVNDLISAGITTKDVEELQRLNWMVEDDYLACFV